MPLLRLFFVYRRVKTGCFGLVTKGFCGVNSIEPPPGQVTAARYGKDAFSVMAWSRSGPGSLLDARFSIAVEGDFMASFTEGDNSSVLPSDTLRLHALAECATWKGTSIEQVAAGTAERVLQANPAFDRAVVEVEVSNWKAIGTRSWADRGPASSARADLRSGRPVLLGGSICDLGLFSTAGSAFAGFYRDPLTTQSEASDRPLAGRLDARWLLRSLPATDQAVADLVTEALTSSFADRSSRSVQQLIHDMARSVLADLEWLQSLDLSFRSAPLRTTPASLLSDGTSVVETWPGPYGLTEVSMTNSRDQ